MSDRRRAERPAHVRPTALVALVRHARSVIDVTLSGRSGRGSGGTRRRTSRRRRVKRADLNGADQRPDVLVCVAQVGREGAALATHHLEVAVEQLVDGRVRPRVPPLVDLIEQPRACLLGHRCRFRPRRDHLDEVVPSPVTGSVPAYTRTRSAPLGSTSIVPRGRARPGLARVTQASLQPHRVTPRVTPGRGDRVVEFPLLDGGAGGVRTHDLTDYESAALTS